MAFIVTVVDPHVAIFFDVYVAGAATNKRLPVVEPALGISNRSIIATAGAFQRVEVLLTHAVAPEPSTASTTSTSMF